MHHGFLSRHSKLALALFLTAAVTGCASVSLEQNMAQLNRHTEAFAEQPLVLAQTAEQQQQQREQAAALLAAPLGAKEAVQLALVNSPAFQALLAQGWAEAAEAAQSGRIANPIFSFERMTMGDELELGRALSFGLLDLLTLPLRKQGADRQIAMAQLRLSGEVVDAVTQVRQAWVRAVAAQQSLHFARQVFESAEASAELARRMQSVGNFNRLSRAREHTYYADAATRLASAQHEAIATREALARQLGLNATQFQQLQVPERLPDLPPEPMPPELVSQMANQGRLDIRLTQTAFEHLSGGKGLNALNSVTDIELTARRVSDLDRHSGEKSIARGYEVEVKLPLFDWGDMQRDAWTARTLAAAKQLEATVLAAGSNLRESYSAYRTAYDIAKHYRDEVLPLRQLISEENLLRYNGMLIGVFELLADARDQVATVMAAMQAQQQFWLADAALHATLIGRPTTTGLSVATPAPASGGAEH